jgi:hypothetical protein
MQAHVNLHQTGLGRFEVRFSLRPQWDKGTPSPSVEVEPEAMVTVEMDDMRLMELEILMRPA